jgi:NADP-dependent 3-hydroxy acid dehydrogenase YdfG
MTGLPAGAVVAVAGAGGPAGGAVVRRLVGAGAFVAGADASAARLQELGSSLGAAAGNFAGQVVDLVEPAAARGWAADVVGEHGRVDGLVHLVGGWRGGSGFADNTAADWQWLERLLVRTLQNTTLAFYDALLAGPASRVVVVSALAASAPTAGNAGYAAAKAAAEAWTLALADGLRAEQSGRRQDPLPQTAAATVLVVKALVHDAMRADKPDATFPGYTDVADLADAVARLWDRPADELNGTRIVLAP